LLGCKGAQALAGEVLFLHQLVRATALCAATLQEDEDDNDNKGQQQDEGADGAANHDTGDRPVAQTVAVTPAACRHEGLIELARVARQVGLARILQPECAVAVAEVFALERRGEFLDAEDDVAATGAVVRPLGGTALVGGASCDEGGPGLTHEHRQCLLRGIEGLPSIFGHIVSNQI